MQALVEDVFDIGAAQPVRQRLRDRFLQGGGAALPEMLASPDYIVRGYGADDRIVYGTGGVIATEGIPARAADLLADPAIAYVHIRSARNNCYQVRIDRG